MKDMFLRSNQDEANRELDCYAYLLRNSIGFFMLGDFDKAAAYHENIVRSLKELGRMKSEKEKWDKVRDLITESESNYQKELLHKMQVNIYE